MTKNELLHFQLLKLPLKLSFAKANGKTIFLIPSISLTVHFSLVSPTSATKTKKGSFLLSPYLDTEFSGLCNCLTILQATQTKNVDNFMQFVKKRLDSFILDLNRFSFILFFLFIISSDVQLDKIAICL